jgi:hypothetical protein
MTLTDKQRKYLWIAVAVIAAVHFLPGYIMQFMPHRSPELAKPSPMRIDPSAPGRVSSLPQGASLGMPSIVPADAPFAGLMGVWNGSAVRPNNTFCRMRLELRRSPDKPGFYAAYSTTTCGPALPIHATTSAQRQVAAIALKQMSPVSASFTGTAVNGALQFDVASNIGSAPDGCMPTSLTVTPFGLSQILAAWKAGTCQGEQMLLQKTPFAPYMN